MSLKEELLSDLKEAMKQKDTVRKNTVTLIRAAILQSEKDNKIVLDDEAIVDVVAKQLKQRKDALTDFIKGGRQDLVDQTNAEISVLMKYLPEQLSRDELKTIVSKAVEKTGAADIKQIGKVMSEVMPQVKGKADGKAVNEVIREIFDAKKSE